jgi:hypothetical protein
MTCQRSAGPCHVSVPSILPGTALIQIVRGAAGSTQRAAKERRRAADGGA